MTAWEKAAKWYDDYGQDERLIESVARCIAGGFVHSSEDLFVLGWEVHWDEEQKQITDGPVNAWFCKIAAGNNVLERSLHVAPRKREWLVWQRNNSGIWKAYRWQRLERHFNSTK